MIEFENHSGLHKGVRAETRWQREKDSFSGFL